MCHIMHVITECVVVKITFVPFHCYVGLGLGEEKTGTGGEREGTT